MTVLRDLDLDTRHLDNTYLCMDEKFRHIPKSMIGTCMIGIMMWAGATWLASLAQPLAIPLTMVKWDFQPLPWTTVKLNLLLILYCLQVASNQRPALPARVGTRS